MDKLIEYIVRNEFDEEKFFHKLENLKEPLILFGCGDRAYFLYSILKEHSITICNVVTSRKFYHEGQQFGNSGLKVDCLEDILKDYEKVNVILGLPKYFIKENLENFSQINEIIDTNFGVVKDYNFGYKFYKDNVDEFQWLYENLADELSRKCLISHLNGRIQGISVPFERSGWIDPQYFLEDIMKWKSKEVIVDCGAYIGDTVEEFLSKKPEKTQYTYYALEPIEDSYNVLEEKFKDNINIKTLKIAAWNEETELQFVQNGEMSSVEIDGCGEIKVKADTIDNIILKEGDKVTFIKMDIEGSEFNALKGAKKVIKRDTPNLAICMYHKKEDLITLPRFISEINSNYRFFLRAHSAMPTELVLFCIPTNI